jgi:hypothetical protein
MKRRRRGDTVTEAAINLPHRAPYTVDDLFEMDRSSKTDLYGEAGIPCYWRVELKPSWRHKGPFPLIVARALQKDGENWGTVEAPAGGTHDLPLAVGPDAWITVTLDPAELVTP